MKPEQAKALREPFPATMIGKLPRKDKTGRQFYLDYVGHAATTDRLLQVDPEWTWEPLGTDERGNPAVVSGLGEPNEPVGLWIMLTVCGVTRPGFGSGKTAKEAISDAIRNAAMRFGVALDLWAKEDLHADNGDKSAGEPSRTSAASVSAGSAADASDGAAAASASPAEGFAEKARKAQEAKNSKPATKAQIARVDALIAKAAAARGKTEDEARFAIVNDYGPLSELTAVRADELAGKLERWAAA